MSDAIWLADVLRNAGLKVVEEPSWKKRGRGDMGEIKGILLHHTAGPLKGNFPSEDVVRFGRAGLRGPLAHLGLARDGTYYVIAAGKTNHAGKGSWKGISNGNSHLIGIEAENTGLSNEPWTKEQYDAYVKGVAAILEYLDLPTDRAIAHKEWAPRRKIDPSFDMNEFREKVDMARKKKAIKKEVIEDFYVPVVTEPPEPEEKQEEEPDFEYSLYKKDVPLYEDQPPKKMPSLSNVPKGFATTGASHKALYAKELLERLGWKDYQAAAMIGNAMYESQTEHLDPEAKGDWVIGKVRVAKGTPGAEWTAFGICQWKFSRLDHLKRFAEDYGKKNNIENPLNDLEVQVRFIDWELRNTEKVAGKMLRESNDILEALRAGISYERPQGWSIEEPERGLGWKDRLIHAYKLLRK